MIERQDYNKLTDFVEHYRKSLPTGKEIILCENYAANSVMRHYAVLAKEEVVDVPEQSNEELCVLIQRGDDRVAEPLLHQNRGFVYQAVLSILSGQNHAVKDNMVQEGYLALLHTAKHFDPTRDMKLLTYAGMFIESAARAVLRAELAQREHRAPLQAANNLTVTDVWDASLDPYVLPPEPYVIRKETIQRALEFIEGNHSATQFDILQRYSGLGNELPQSVEEIAIAPAYYLPRYVLQGISNARNAAGPFAAPCAPTKTLTSAGSARVITARVRRAVPTLSPWMRMR